MNSVFLFSILGMGAGFFELGKFAGKVENCEKLRSMKSAKPSPNSHRFSQVTYFVILENILTLFCAFS